MCPRSSDPFYIVSYNIKWVTTSWTNNIHKVTEKTGTYPRQTKKENKRGRKKKDVKPKINKNQTEICISLISTETDRDRKQERPRESI